MKKLMCFVFLLVTGAAFAEGPFTYCPPEVPTAIIVQTTLSETVCPSDYIQVGQVLGCLTSDIELIRGAGCYMFAPSGDVFTNEAGTYEYTEICPLTQ